MRVMLVQAYTMIDEAPIFPLGLCTLAAAIGDRHEVAVFDTNTADAPTEDLAGRLREFEPDVVGVSFRNIKVARPGTHRSTLPLYRALVTTVRRASPDAVVIGGGAAFSLYAKPLMAGLPQLDLGVFGEAEETLPDLLANIHQPDRVRGVYTRGDGAVRFTGARPMPDYAHVPWPRYDLVNLDDYKDNPTGVGVMTKRGCPLRCLHCSDRELLGPVARMRPPEDVGEHLAMLADRYGLRQFMFADQVFNIPGRHATAICQQIVDRRLKLDWLAWFNERPITRDFVRLARAAGCRTLDFSPDSISDDVLRALRKNIRQADVDNVVRVAREEGIPINFNFMINGPGETLGSLLRLAVFLVRTKLRLGRLFRLHGLCLAPMRIYPNTELHELALRRGLVRPDDDLIEPRFYNPPPLCHVADAMLWVLQAAWQSKHVLKALVGRHSPDVLLKPHAD